MTLINLAIVATVATLFSGSTMTMTFAQTAPADQNQQSGSSEMMPGTMMGRADMMVGMRGHMMKIMFAIADVDGDEALSFEEVTTIHKRVFDNVDANKDGKVTTDEVQGFMRDR